jgi:hypothetical protein
MAQAAGGPASSRQIRPSSRVSSRAVLDVVCAGSKTRMARTRSGGSVGKIRAKSASVQAPTSASIVSTNCRGPPTTRVRDSPSSAASIGTTSGPTRRSSRSAAVLSLTDMAK